MQIKSSRANYDLTINKCCNREKIALWKYAPPLIQCRDAFVHVSCDECLYALGGYNTDDNEYLSSAERLTHLDGEWQNIEPMQTPRRWFAAVNCIGVVYAIGGKSGKENLVRLKSVEKYDSTEINGNKLVR